MTKLLPYIRIARPDHWFKNVFMLPGVAVAWFAVPELRTMDSLLHVVLGIVAVCIIASSYYVLNEVRDAPFDALHPTKRHRPVPSGQVNTRIAYVQCVVLGVIGLGLSALVSVYSLVFGACLLAMGCIYNLPPLRSKDLPYFDVLTESINNPLRLLLGWYATGITLMIPASLILAYWMLGAFFMTVKRLAEYRSIGDSAVASSYRKSFTHYNESRLMVSTIYYAVAFGLALGIFLVRYRVELILGVPFLAGFIAWYLHMGLAKDSPAQAPEQLYRQRGFMAFTGFCMAVIIALLYVDIPVLSQWVEPTIRVQSQVR